MDLRVMYDNEEDYANPIEPSTNGGRKMVSMIDRICNEHEFELGNTTLYA